MPRPYELSDQLSAIVLGTMRSPGVVTLSGHDRPQEWDIQPAKGKTGASTTLGGAKPRQFEASFFLADDSNPREIDIDAPGDFDLWEDFQRLIESMTSGPAPFALPIFHPDLARVGITEVTNAGVGGMVHDGKGGATVKVKFLEYRPAKTKKTASPTGKAASTGARVGTTTVSAPDPNAAAKAELAALLEEARKP